MVSVSIVPFMSMLLVSLIAKRGTGGVRGHQRETARQLVVAAKDQAHRGDLGGNDDAATDVGVLEDLADDLAHVLDECERRTLVATAKPRGDVGTAPCHRNVDAPLCRRPADEAARGSNPLATGPAHLVAPLGVNVAAQRVAAPCLVDAEVFDRNPAGAWSRDRPANAIEHAHLPSQLVLRGRSDRDVSQSLRARRAPRGRGAGFAPQDSNE